MTSEIKHDLEKIKSVPGKFASQDRMMLVTSTLVRGFTVSLIFRPNLLTQISQKFVTFWAYFSNAQLSLSKIKNFFDNFSNISIMNSHNFS